MTYTVKTNLKPTALHGISDAQIAQHWKLYEGYVANVNALTEDLDALRKQGRSHTALYADRRRRRGFEFNGMVLHEYYFGNLKAGTPEPRADSPLGMAFAQHFGSFAALKEDFLNTGATRSVGWAILYLDPVTKGLTNHFVELHEGGHIAGFTPLLVMDVWEHAYMVDHDASGRTEYMKAFFANINWPLVAARYAAVPETRTGVRGITSQQQQAARPGGEADHEHANV